MKFTLLLLVLLISHTSYANPIIYSLNDKEIISEQRFIHSIRAVNHFVFGEFHYHKCIQDTEAYFIKIITDNRDREFTVGMEFINNDVQEETDYWSIEYMSGAIGLRDFTFKLLGENSQNLRYSPILRETILNNGELLGTNSPRDIKTKMIKDGYESIPDKYKTQDFYDGSYQYFERFKKAMEGHVGDEALSKYFLAQVYTDNYIAEKFIEKKRYPIGIQIIGSFHSDYFDGFISQYSKRTNNPIISIKFVSKKDMDSIIKEPSRFGPVSHFLVGCE